MKTIEIYPVISINIEVPDDYEERDVLDETELIPDFSKSKLPEGCKMTYCGICGHYDEHGFPVY